MAIPPKRSVDPGKIARNVYADQAQANRTAEAGLYWAPMPANLGSAQQVQPRGSIMLYNSDTAIHYVAFGTTDSVTAPSSALTGLPVPPGSIIAYATGPNTYVISDSSLVFGYTNPADPYNYPVQLDANPPLG